MEKMNILICTETLTAGGAEIFLMNWASEANKNGIKTFIYCFHKRLNQNPSIQKHLHHTKVFYPYDSEKKDLRIARIDQVLKKLNVPFSFRERKIKKDVYKLSLKHKINVLHSHLLPCDLLVAQSKLSEKTKHFTTIHGDYLRHYFTPRDQRKIKHFDQKLDTIKKSLSGIVCISDQQLDFFKNKLQWSLPAVKIYNGFQFEKPPTQQESEKFIVGMVSRGIKEKGWKEACDAFIHANIPNSELQLIGESDYLSRLKMEYTSYKNIRFLGYHPNPLEKISHFDLGLLPSYYGSESLPTVVIEYLKCGVPVIASNIGEVQNMLTLQHQEAGIIIESDRNPIEINKLSEAIVFLFQNQEERKKRAQTALECSKKFNIEKCLKDYLHFYKSVSE